MRALGRGQAPGPRARAVHLGAVNEPSPDALGVVRNLPGGVAGAAGHPPVVPAPAVLGIQEDPEHGGNESIVTTTRLNCARAITSSPAPWGPPLLRAMTMKLSDDQEDVSSNRAQ
jgi:hypothetical protein